MCLPLRCLWPSMGAKAFFFFKNFLFFGSGAGGAGSAGDSSCNTAGSSKTFLDLSFFDFLFPASKIAESMSLLPVKFLGLSPPYC